MSSTDSVQPPQGPLSRWGPYYLVAGIVAVIGVCLIVALWQQDSQRDVIRRVLAVDESLGRIRDQGMTSKTDAGATATAVQHYVDAMNAVNMNDLPETVHVAYGEHLQAWGALAALYGEYSGLSGAFKAGYDGDDAVNAKIAACQKQVRDSWDQVRAACMEYGVDAPQGGYPL